MLCLLQNALGILRHCANFLQQYVGFGSIFIVAIAIDLPIAAFRLQL